VFYYAEPNINGKARLKGRCSAYRPLRGQADTGSLVRIRIAQWIARLGDFLGIRARAKPTN